MARQIEKGKAVARFFTTKQINGMLAALRKVNKTCKKEVFKITREPDSVVVVAVKPDMEVLRL